MTSTLTLSGVEQVAVLQHLELQYAQIPASAPDSPIVHRILTQVGSQRTITLTKLEAFIMMRYLRRQKNAVQRDMMELEERVLRGGHNGGLEGAHRALDADSTAMEDVLRRLWAMLV